MLRYNGRVFDTGDYGQVAREVRIIGRNPALTTVADLWAPGVAVSGVHSLQPAAGVILAVVSSSVNDVVGGTGATAVGVVAVDINGVEQNFFLPLNGHTAVVDIGTRKIVAVNEFYCGPVWVQALLNGTTTIKVPTWITDNLVANVTVVGTGIAAGTLTVSSTPGTIVVNNAATLGTTTNPVSVMIGFGAMGSTFSNVGKIDAYDSTDTLTVNFENTTIAKRMSIIDATEIRARTGFYTVPSLADPNKSSVSVAPAARQKADLLILGIECMAIDNTATAKFMSVTLLSNWIKRNDIWLGQPGVANWITEDLGTDTSNSNSAALPPSSIEEPFIVIGNGGVVRLQGIASAAPNVSAQVQMYCLLVTPNTLY